MTTPPKAGSRPSVRVDQELSDNLAVMMRAGLTLSDAVRHAVATVAGAYATAWDQGVVPQGIEPRIIGFQVERHPDCPTPPTSGNRPGPTRRPTPRPTPGVARPTGAPARATRPVGRQTPVGQDG